MPSPVSDTPSGPEPAATPTISAHGHLVTGSGFLPDHNVSIRITRAGEDISDYLTYLADGYGTCIASYRPAPRAGLHIAATDHRREPDGACGRLWSNTYTLVVAEI